MRTICAQTLDFITNPNNLVVHRPGYLVEKIAATIFAVVKLCFNKVVSSSCDIRTHRFLICFTI